MIVPNKGLYTDGNPNEQPQGTWRKAVNMVYDKSKQTLQTEQGHIYFDQNLPDAELIGQCTMFEEVVLFFSTSGTSSIGVFDFKSGIYNEVYSNNLVLNFYDEHIIKAKFYQNANNERIIIFTDGVNPLRFVNIDNPIALNAKSINLMGNEVETVPSDITASYFVEGNLQNGTYYVFYRFVTKEGRFTNYVITDKGYRVGTEIETPRIGEARPNESSGKAIGIRFENIDQDYEFLEVGVITKINEVTSAKLVTAQPITTNTYDILINNLDNKVDLAFEEIFTPYINYPSVKDIEIIQDELVLAGTKENFPLNYQKYALDIRIDYTVKEDLDTDFTNDEVFSFMPGEVYAFYIVFLLKDGSFSKAYHIAGRDGSVAEKASSNLYASGYFYQVEDTANNGTALTNMGFWQNDNELYPNTSDFQSVDGRDLRGEKVRHHRFPSVAHVREQHGLTSKKLPQLGIKIGNVNIPDHINDQVNGYFIVHSKRTVDNMLVLGYSDYQRQGENEGGDTDLIPDGKAMAIPCNLRTSTTPDTGPYVAPYLSNGLRFTNYDLLKNKPIIKPKYLWNEVKVESKLHSNTGDDTFAGNNSGIVSEDRANGNLKVFIDFYKNDDSDGANEHGITWTNVRDASNTPDTDYQINRVVDHQYVAHNVDTNGIDNRIGAEFIHLKGDSAGRDEIVSTTDLEATAVHISYISALRQIIDDVYVNFYEQNDLVIVKNSFQEITSNGIQTLHTSYGGDVNITVFNYIASGALTPNYAGYFVTDPLPEDYKGKGVIVLKSLPVYSVAPLKYIYDETREISKYGIETNLNSLLGSYNYQTQYLPSHDKSLTLSNDANAIIPFNALEKNPTFHPFRLHRSTKIARTETRVNFEFLFNSWYEMPNTKGEITGINAFNERLIIRHRYTTFITTPIQSLKTASGTATLGENDLFDLRPQELISTDNGFVGSSNPFSCIINEWGALIVDDEQGKVFLYSSSLEEISKLGNENLMRRNLTSLFNYYSQPKIFTIQSEAWIDNKQMFEINLEFQPNAERFTYNIGDFIYSNTTETAGKIVKIEMNGHVIKLYTDLRGANTTHAGIVHFKKIFNKENSVKIGYDPKLQRFLITKSDPYDLRYNSEEYFKGFFRLNDNPEDGNIYIKDVPSVYDSVEGFTPLSILQRNNNKTYSYYPDSKYKFWVSEHTYYPNLYINNRNEMMYIDNNRVIRINSQEANFQFLGQDYNSEIELVHNIEPYIAKKYVELVFKTMVNSINNGENINIATGKTFDSVQFKNDIQDSDIVPLVNYTNINAQGNMRMVHNVWKFNLIRDNENNLMVDTYLSLTFRVNPSNLLYLYGFDLSFNPVKNL